MSDSDGKPTNHRKVYGRGFHDGMREAMMNPIREQSALQNCTSLAQKVYQCVPIGEAWTVPQVVSEVSRIGMTHIEFKTVAACLNQLAAAKLIKEPARGHFQRHRPHVATPKEVKKPSPVKLVEPPPAVTILEDPLPEQKPPKAPAPRNPLNIVTDLVSRIDHVIEQLGEVKGELEAAALEFDEQLATTSEDSIKLRKLQEILNSLKG